MRKTTINLAISIWALPKERIVEEFKKEIEQAWHWQQIAIHSIEDNYGCDTTWNRELSRDLTKRTKELEFWQHQLEQTKD